MILKRTSEVEIGIDNRGYLIISEDGSIGEPAVVGLSYDQTICLYRFIRKNLKEQKKRWFENDDSTEVEWLE